MTQILSTADVATACHVPDWKIRRLFEDGNLPEPPRVSGRRVFDQSMIPQIIQALVQRGWWKTVDARRNSHSELALV